VERNGLGLPIRGQEAQVKGLGPGYAEACHMDLPPVEVVDLRAELRAGNRSPSAARCSRPCR
jgi:hypothetical protein